MNTTLKLQIETEKKKYIRKGIEDLNSTITYF